MLQGLKRLGEWEAEAQRLISTDASASGCRTHRTHDLRQSHSVGVARRLERPRLSRPAGAIRPEPLDHDLGGQLLQRETAYSLDLGLEDGRVIGTVRPGRSFFVLMTKKW